MAAIRFILHSRGAYPNVDEQKMVMENVSQMFLCKVIRLTVMPVKTGIQNLLKFLDSGGALAYGN
jgi:hypothetical protein